jgi:hypothetical protein
VGQNVTKTTHSTPLTEPIFHLLRLKRQKELWINLILRINFLAEFICPANFLKRAKPKQLTDKLFCMRFLILFLT